LILDQVVIGGWLYAYVTRVSRSWECSKIKTMVY